MHNTHSPLSRLNLNLSSPLHPTVVQTFRQFSFYLSPYLWLLMTRAGHRSGYPPPVVCTHYSLTMRQLSGVHSQPPIVIASCGTDAVWEARPAGGVLTISPVAQSKPSPAAIRHYYCVLITRALIISFQASYSCSAHYLIAMFTMMVFIMALYFLFAVSRMCLRVSDCNALSHPCRITDSRT